MGYRQESTMRAQRCCGLLLEISVGKPVHNRAIPLRQTNNNKTLVFWAELLPTLTKFAPYSPLLSSNDLAVSSAQTHQKITALCSRVGYFLFFQCLHLERFVI